MSANFLSFLGFTLKSEPAFGSSTCTAMCLLLTVDDIEKALSLDGSMEELDALAATDTSKRFMEGLIQITLSHLQN